MKTLNSFNLFIQSFKTFNKNFINAVLFDFLGYLLFFTAIAVFYAMFGYLTDGTSAPFTSELVYTLFIIIISLITVAIIALGIAAFKRLAYKITNKQKISFKAYYKYAFLWTLLWFIIYAVFALVMRESILPILMFFLWLIYTYFTTISRTVMTESYKETVRKTFDISVQIHKFIIPIILIIAVAWVLAFITGIIGTLGAETLLGVGIIVTLFFITWARYYIYLIVKNIEENNKSYK